MPEIRLQKTRAAYREPEPVRWAIWAPNFQVQIQPDDAVRADVTTLEPPPTPGYGWEV